MQNAGQSVEDDISDVTCFASDKSVAGTAEVIKPEPVNAVATLAAPASAAAPADGKPQDI